MKNYGQTISVNQLLKYQSSVFPVPIILVSADWGALLMLLLLMLMLEIIG